MVDTLTQGNTLVIRPGEAEKSIRETFAKVYEALQDKGYDPVNQIVGYLMSGDPTYITSHREARGLIATLQRDDIVEFLVRKYLSAENM